jgi:acyl-CoA synthetase (NDP forming)
MDDRLKNLDYAFNPRSIAFVGATETLLKWGFLILNNLISGGYKGDIYPVNPSRETVMGIKAYPRVRDIAGDVDLAVFTVPARHVVEALDDCIAKGVKAGLVITAGFKELGEDGALMEQEMLRRARDAGMLLIGPNCQGICCPGSRLYPWMPILFHPPGGNISFVAQSGNILNMLIGQAVSAGLGVSKAVSSGNEADISTEEYFSYFGEDPDTDVIVSYIEGIEDGRRFIDLAREVTRRKPVVALKGGRTQSGMSAARSHTGSMAVSERLFEAACRQAGVILTTTIEEAGIIASSFVGRPLPQGRRVGIVTGGGGLGVIAADYCSEIGLEVAPLSPRVLKDLSALLPDWWVPGNPVDLVAGLDFNVLKPSIEILARSGEVDAVMLLWIGATRRGDVSPSIKEVGGLDVNIIWDFMDKMMGDLPKELNKLMLELQIPLYLSTTIRAKYDDADPHVSGNRPLIFPNVETACRAISAMADYQAFLSARD